MTKKTDEFRKTRDRTAKLNNDKARASLRVLRDGTVLNRTMRRAIQFGKDIRNVK